MSFLDSQGDAAEEGGAPASPAPAPSPGGAPPGGPPGGGPILAALANRQRPGGPKVSAPGPGDQASSMTMLMQAVGMIQHALPGLTPGTPIHQDALRAVTRLSKHIPSGQPAEGVQRTQLQDLLQNLLKGPLLARIIGQQRQQQPGGQPGGPAPMPSTPLPGA